VKNHITFHRSVIISFIVSSFLLLTGIAEAGQTLENFAGKPQTIGQYATKGKWLIVMIWAHDCPVCNKEVHNYVDFYNAHKNKDATVLGISIDGAEKKADAQDFLKRHKVNFPSLIGEPEVVAQIYQDVTNDYFRGTPTFMIYGPNGEIRAADAGAVPVKLIESFMKRKNSDASGKSSGT